ncbi:uncharacterized protein JCM6883_000318 [Sporobolomyces salmoneus]|uniref:uncharacterized protein n=1 Tax=Sporobolomyces salmoneus TaxID=183962 RepID=UPI003181B76D
MPPRKKPTAAATTDSTPAAAVADEDSNGIDQFELPKSVIARLAKSSVPSEVKLQKEVPLALVKGSTVFINYLAALSHDLATEKNQKTISAAHVLEAVKQLGWEDGGKGLERELKKELKGFRKIVEAKKAGTYTAPKKQPKPAASSTTKKGLEPVASTSTSKSVEPTEGEGEQTTDEQPDDVILQDDRPNQDEDPLYPGAEDEEMEGIELYDDEAQQADEELEDEGLEGSGDEGVDEPIGGVDVELDDVEDDDGD